MRSIPLYATCCVAALTAGIALAPPDALAWGHTGHVYISELGIRMLPSEIPAFLRANPTVHEIAELGPEPDVSKSTGAVTGGAYPNIRTAGTIHDFERDPGHYIDLQDDGLVTGGVQFWPLLSSRRDFDTALRASKLTPPSNTQYFAGYLPYNIVDGWQQVRKDFALFRAFRKAVETAQSPSDKAYFYYALQLRQQLILRDIGVWSHFVADGSQPLHVSVHFNGWGDYPNPNNYSDRPLHAPFEGALVKNDVTIRQIAAAMLPYQDCGCAIEQRVVQYLQATFTQVEPLYALELNDPLFANPNPDDVDFATSRLAAGAAELRDEIVDAWHSSETITVGYPLIKVSDIEAGTVTLTPDMLAGD